MSRLSKGIMGLVIGCSFCFANANAAIMDVAVPNNAFITVGGYDWAWAGPCAPNDPSCGVIDLSFQGGQGWALPTVAEMDAAVAAAGSASAWANLFLFSGANWAAGTQNAPGGGLTTINNTGSDFACASAYFSSNWTHCDFNDAVSGVIFNLSGAPPALSTEEVFVLRNSVSPVPLPAAAWLFMSAIAGVGMVARRRQQQA